MEAIIPLEIGLPTMRTEAYNHEQNKERIAEHLYMIEERNEKALIRLAAYQQQLVRSYQKKVRERIFKIEDRVLRKVLSNTRDPNHGKLGPTWEGPYRVTSVGRAGAYHLEALEGKALKRPWNVTNLKKFYY